MRFSGSKGFAQKKRHNRIAVAEPVDPTEVNEDGHSCFYYVSSGPFSPYAGFTPDYEELTQVVEGQGELGWIFDLGGEEQVAFISFKGEDNIGGVTLYWSHDRVRWFKHSGTSNVMAHYAWGGATDYTPMFVSIQQPVPKARYWKLSADGATSEYTPDPNTRWHTSEIRVGIIEKENVIIDTSLSYAYLDSGSLLYHYDTGAYHLAHILPLGWPPEVIWQLTWVSFDETASDKLLPTNRTYMGMMHGSDDYDTRFNNPTQLRTDGVGIPDAVVPYDYYGTGIRDKITINGEYSDFSDVYTIGCFMLAFRNDQKDGTWCPINYNNSGITEHGLGKIPDFVMFWDGFTTMVTHKDAFGVSLRLGAETQDTWANDDIDISSTHLFHKVWDDYMHMVCLCDSAGKRKFGEYTGNGSTTGPVVTGLGFQPDFILIIKDKAADTDETYGWINNANRLSKRQLRLQATPDTTYNTSVTATLDSNGFSITCAESEVNESSAHYVWAAFNLWG